MALSHSDYKSLLDIINTIHSIPDRNQMLKAVCGKLEEHVGISSAAFIPLDHSTRGFAYDGHFLYNISSTSSMMLFCTYYAALNPVAAAGIHLNTSNTACRITDVISASRFAETEYARDFSSLTQIFYELCMTITCQGNPVAGMGLHRKKREKDFSARDKVFMNFVLPHLSRALHNQQLMDTVASSREVGVIILGTAADPLFMNDVAKQALDGKPASLVPDPDLCNVPTFFKTAKGIYRVLSKTTGMNGKEKVLFLEPLPGRQYLRSRLLKLGLTPRQEEIAALTIQGHSNIEIAERLLITEQTVKDHLRAVFEKAGVRKRTALTAKIIGVNAQA